MNIRLLIPAECSFLLRKQSTEATRLSVPPRCPLGRVGPVVELVTADVTLDGAMDVHRFFGFLTKTHTESVKQIGHARI
jgi:hypothetical protein